MSIGQAKEGKRCAWVAAMALLVAGGWSGANGAPAPSTGPVERRLTSASDDIPLIHREAPRTSADRATAAPTDGLSTGRVVGALVVVVATILAFRWLGQRVFGLQATGAGSGAIRILARSAVSPRQQLLLIQVGRRLLLVANSGTQMNSLCEIHDADEVAVLMGQIQQGRTASSKRSFLSAFRSAGAEFAQPDAPPGEQPAGEVHHSIGTDDMEPSALAGAREEIAGLLEKVRSISGSLRRA